MRLSWSLQFIFALSFLRCVPALADSTTSMPRSGGVQGEPPKLDWDERCKKHQKIVRCVQVYKPVECRVGDLAVQGSNMCFAEHNLIVRICARPDRSMYQYGPIACRPLLIGK